MQKKLSDKYKSMQTLREPFVNRAKDYSKLTIKQLLEKSETGSSESKTRAYTSLGAKLVSHLANKVVMTLFPLGHNFFLPKPNADKLDELNKSGLTEDDLKPQMLAIAKMGTGMLSGIQDRQTQIELAKHLIITGNIAVFYPEGKRCVLIPITDYVCKRSMTGDVNDFVWKTVKSYGELAQDSQAAFKRGKSTAPKPTDKVDIYTGFFLQSNGKFEFIQEVNDVRIQYEKDVHQDDLPFDVLRWNKNTGEDYGHSHVEDNAADLFCFIFLTKCMAKGMALMCDVKYIVKNGMTNIHHLLTSDIGEFITGDINDIGVLQLGKFADYSQVQVVREEYRRELGAAFMMNSAVRRNAERVTTYELKLDAAELESNMGGVYSLLADAWQMPLAKRIIAKMHPSLKGTMDFSIVTGLETLGQAGELDKLAQFSQLMQLPNSWSPAVQQRMKWSEYIRDVSYNIGLSSNWIMSDEEFQKEQAAQQQAQQNQQMTDGVAKAIPAIAQPMAQAAVEE